MSKSFPRADWSSRDKVAQLFADFHLLLYLENVGILAEVRSHDLLIF